MEPIIGIIILMNSKNEEFGRVSRPGSMHHDDPVDLQIEQNVFENGMTWVGIDPGQRKSTMESDGRWKVSFRVSNGYLENRSEHHQEKACSAKHR